MLFGGPQYCTADLLFRLIMQNLICIFIGRLLRDTVLGLQVPKALERLFASNYDMLLSIFNPEGWLDITYVDDTHRIGRDDKGNVFYLQRS